MGRPVGFADVRLEFYDLSDPPALTAVVSNEPGSQQTTGRLERLQGD